MGTCTTKAYRAALIALAFLPAVGKAQSECYEHYTHLEQLKKQNATLVGYNQYLLRQNAELNWKLSRVDSTHPWANNPDAPKETGKLRKADEND